MNHPAHSKPCVLVAEDEPMLAMLLEDLLDASGYRVLLAHTLTDAMTLASTESVDAAILDVTLGRENSFPLADELRQRAVPLLFASGYGREGVPERFADVTTLQKPYDTRTLKGALSILLATVKR
jgi:DNA-binding response OmpR family regulator